MPIIMVVGVALTAALAGCQDTGPKRPNTYPLPPNGMNPPASSGFDNRTNGAGAANGNMSGGSGQFGPGANNYNRPNPPANGSNAVPFPGSNSQPGAGYDGANSSAGFNGANSAAGFNTGNPAPNFNAGAAGPGYGGAGNLTSANARITTPYVSQPPGSLMSQNVPDLPPAVPMGNAAGNPQAIIPPANTINPGGGALAQPPQPAIPPMSAGNGFPSTPPSPPPMSYAPTGHP
jgi:hypothetical protein